MLAKSISISIRLLLNDETERCARFLGFAHVEAGFLSGGIHGQSGKLAREEAVLLTAFTLTGCPLAARSVEGAANPWRRTSGAYIGLRVLESAQFRAESRIESKSFGERIEMDLSVRLDGELPRLSGVAAPFQEAMIADGPGRIVGAFDILFGDELGRRIPAHAGTVYKLEMDEVPHNAWRNITIVTSDSGPFQQIEQIDLFRNVETARSELEARLRVSQQLFMSAGPEVRHA